MHAMRTGVLERWFLAGSCLLAMTGAVWMATTLPWPVDAGPGQFPMVAAWQKLVQPFADARFRSLMPGLIALDAFLAAGLASALAWKPAARAEGRLVARALAFGAVSVAYLFQARLYLPSLPLQPLADAAAFALGGAGIANLCAFLYRYPRPPALDDLAAFARREPSSAWYAPIRRWRLALARRLPGPVARGLGFERVIEDWQVSVWMGIGQASHRLRPQLGLVACAGLVGLLLSRATERSAANTFVLMVCALVPVFLCSIAFVWLQAKYNMGTAEDRRRIGWIYLGPVAAFVAMTLVMFGLLLAGTFIASDAPVLFGAPLIVWWLVATFCFMPVVVAGFLLGLAFSVYYAGAFDPRLAMRRSLLAGLSGVTLTLLFVGLENLASSELAARIGLTGQASTLAAGTVAALVLAPLRSRLEALVGRWMDGLMPEGDSGAPAELRNTEDASA